MARVQRQKYFPGTEPPEDPVEKLPDEVRNGIDRALDDWFDAKAEQKAAGETTKVRHASLLEKIAEAGLEQYPYIDPFTGKKRFAIVAREPKIKLLNAPRPKRRDREEPGDEVGPEDMTPAERNADRVEHRKVSRASVEAEIDPFAKTRGILDEARERQADAGGNASDVGEWSKSEGNPYAEDDDQPAAKKRGGKPKKGS